MAESRSTVGPVPRTHSDYPHLSDEEWNAVGRLANQLGEEATLHMLSMSEQAQKSALRNFISSNVTTNEVPTTSTANTAVPYYSSKVKLEASIYGAREYENLAQWFVEVQTALRARRIGEDDMQVAYAMSRLGGRARSWAYSRIMSDPTCFPNWETLKTELMEAFQPPKTEFRTRAQYLRLTQGKKSVHEYAQQARVIASSITQDPIDETTKVSVFLNGLKDGPVRDQLFRVVPRTLEQCITIALQEDFSLRQSRGYGNKIPYQNFVKSGNGPTPMDLSVARMQQKDKRDIVCFRCQKKGHYSNECKSPFPVNKTGNQNYNKNYNKNYNNNNFSRRSNRRQNNRSKGNSNATQKN